MKKVLVFGGTRFFGKRLVDKLIQSGVEVTVATRGITDDGFGDQVKRVVLDREVDDERWDAVSSQKWDIVYDNICYTSSDAKIASERLSGKVGKYIFTSTLSVYDFGGEAKKEEEFDGRDYPLSMVQREDVDYKEGKRLAEAYFFQKSELPVVAVRFPIVLGLDDYTKRLHFHINKVVEDKEIGVVNSDAKMGYITSTEAGDFLLWLGSVDVSGSVNATSDGTFSMKEILAYIEQETNKKAIVTSEISEENGSPFGVPEDWYMSTRKAREAGYFFSDAKEWMPRLIADIVAGK